jgi:putative copper export protein
MIGVTLFGLFLTPVFYVLIRRLASRTARASALPGTAAAPGTRGSGGGHA